MRLITLTEAVKITSDMFTDYVEPLGMSMMSGEIPSIMFMIHQRGSKDLDWLAHVRFKNTLPISVFKCEIYLDDVFRLCRRCKLWLITENVFKIVVLYAMLHPLYQTQHIDFSQDVTADYESMMAGAGKSTYQFIKDYYISRIEADSVDIAVLDILQYHMMQYTNKTFPGMRVAQEEAKVRLRLL